MNLKKKRVKIQKGSTVMKGTLAKLSILEIKEERRAITREEIDVGQDQPAEIIHDLLRIINKYCDCVELNMSELGCARCIEVESQEAETVPQLPPEIETQPPQTDAPKPENSTSRIFKARKRAAEALEHQAK
uniref:Uncharacterized protein n=1 Tax=Trichogramma kaykai TaxID=54128 RepID=A0ABD2VWF0_9HYME